MKAVDPLAPRLALRLFGPFEARVGENALPHLRTRRGEWLLALLALRAGQEVERGWLAGSLWPESSEAQALSNLRVSLTDLRHALGAAAGCLRAPSPRSLALDLAAVEIDLLAFDAAIARGDDASLEQAAALYRGPLLEGCGEEWAFQERQAREQAYLAARERLAALAFEQGETAAAERHLRLAVAVDPLRESTQRALMQVLAAGGNYAAALLCYRELRLHLHRELNAEPDAETQTLFQQLRGEARRLSAKGSGVRSYGPGVRKDSEEGAVGPISARTDLRAPAPGPTGTVTFLFTDIEGSTRLWEADPEAMRAALVRHDTLLRDAIEAGGGVVFKTFGDQFCAAFAAAPEALAAALAAQRALHAEPWGQEGRRAAADDPPAGYPGAPTKWVDGCGAPGGGALRVRMALHTGTAEERDSDYFGPPLNRVARLLAAAHGGQTLLSLATVELVRDPLPDGASLRDLGERRLQDLTRPERIFQLVTPDLPADFPPLRSLEPLALANDARCPHNLPLQLTSFIGREEAIAEVKQLLATTRLLTLTGSGGCGKTRLALQVAADLLEEYADGVWLVELAPLADPALVPQTVASALGVREEPGRPLTATLTDCLRPKSLLFVLDNCEHLLTACAQLADALLRSCPSLRMLATSREGLGIAGERTYRVPSLSLPEPRPLPPVERLMEYEALRLFVERAVFTQPRFAVTEQNAPAVAQVCSRLDGIPLAIELAAARVKVLSVEQINARIGDRFRLLTGGSRTALPRQQTLRALIDWSYDLLTEAERPLLCRLSVFAGGWTLEAAEAVCAGEGIETWEVLDLLTALVEKSLVVVGEQGAEPRYRLLETVRQYARDRLVEAGDGEVVQARHRDWFLALAERAEPELTGPEQGQWLDRLETEHDNLRAAIDGCLAEEGGAAEEGLRLTGAVSWFWLKRGYLGEGRQRIERALSRSPSASAPARIKALRGAGGLAYFQGDIASTRSRCEASLALAREAGDRRGTAYGLCQLAFPAAEAGDYEQATALATECLAVSQEIGDPWFIAHALNLLGFVARLQGDSERATRLFVESLALFREGGDPFAIAVLLVGLGGVRQSQGDNEEARGHYQEGLALAHEMADKRGMTWCLEGLAGVAISQGQAARAARLLGVAEALLEGIGHSLPPSSRAAYGSHVAAARTALGEEAFAAAWAEGRAMSLDQACADAPQGQTDA